MNLLEGLLDLGDDKLDRADLTICWQRPSALDGLSTGDGETGIHIGALRECLDAAEKVIPIDADQPHCELLELANGLAHGGSAQADLFCLTGAFGFRATPVLSDGVGEFQPIQIVVPHRAIIARGQETT
jgi:hypothetical protein